MVGGGRESLCYPCKNWSCLRAGTSLAPASPSTSLLVWRRLGVCVLEQSLAAQPRAKGGLTLPSSSLQVIIADDYSDPFDAKNDLKSKAGKGESAGYMEPYEAQRIMTGKPRSRHRDSQLSRVVGSPLPDTQGWSRANLGMGRFVLSRRPCCVECFPWFTLSRFTCTRRNLAGCSGSPDTRAPRTINEDRDREVPGGREGKFCWEFLTEERYSI